MNGRQIGNVDLGPLLAATLSLAFSAVFILRSAVVIDGHRWFTLFDDAMISMRYARNLVEGHGLVWNPGGPRVEGYSNLLWTLWMAGLHWIGIPERFVAAAVSTSGALLIAGTVVVSARIATRIAPDRGRVAAAAVTATVVAGCYPLLYWTLRGFEVGALTFVLVLAVDLAFRLEAHEARALPLLAGCLAAMTLLRSDGVVPALAIVAAVTTAPALDRRTRVILWATPLAVLAAHAAARMAYYGAPLPNTYYLKMTGVPLLERITTGATLTADAAARYMAVLLVIASVGGRWLRRGADAALITVPAALLLYAAYAGADAWEWMPYTDRYLTPAYPLLGAAAASTLTDEGVGRRRLTAVVLFIFSGLYALGGSPPHLAVASAVVVLVLIASGLLPPIRAKSSLAAAALCTAGALVLVASSSGRGFLDWARNGAIHVADDGWMLRAGLAVRASTAPDAKVAVVWAGTLPYFARRPAVDLLGMNDPVIARGPVVGPFWPGHNKWDYDYSLTALRPDLLMLQLWDLTPKEYRLIAQAGYVRIRQDDMFVLAGTRAVDLGRLQTSMPPP